MANNKSLSLLFLALLVFSMLATEVLAQYTEGSLKPKQCLPQCKKRCSNTQYRRACMRFCRKCCLKCLCVPRGTYGNKETCPCYNNWKTQQGGPKCP